MAEKVISLDGVHDQLVDINNGIVAFNVVIVITPPDEEMSKEYSIGIGTQSQIDNKKDISFSLIKGVYKKSFTHTPVDPTAEAEVFYVVMNSQQPVNNIKVQIDLKELGVSKPQQPPQPQPQPPQVREQFKQPTTSKTTYLKYIVAVTIVVFGAYFLYNFWKKSRTEKSNVVVAQPEVAPASAPALEPIKRTSVPRVDIKPPSKRTEDKPMFTFY